MKRFSDLVVSVAPSRGTPGTGSRHGNYSLAGCSLTPRWHPRYGVLIDRAAEGKTQA